MAISKPPEEDPCYCVEVYFALSDREHKPIDWEKLRKALEEIRQEFGGSTEKQIGFFRDPKTGEPYDEETLVVRIITPPTASALGFFKERGEGWRSQMRQKLFLITQFDVNGFFWGEPSASGLPSL